MSTAPNEPVAGEAHGWLSNVMFFVALLSTALALGGALAHLYELPNKIDLPQDRCFIVQGIYRGWWQLAYLLGIQLLSILAVIVVSVKAPKVPAILLIVARDDPFQ